MNHNLHACVTLRRAFAWLRLLIFLAAICGTALAVWYEYGARLLLTKARRLEDQGAHTTAFLAYATLVERFPFSLTVYEARAGVSRLEERAGRAQIDRHMLTDTGHNVLRASLDPYRVDYLPLYGFSFAAAWAFLVCLTRLRRRKGVAFLAFLVLGTSLAGIVCTASNAQMLGSYQMDVAPLIRGLPTLYLAYGALGAVSLALLLGFTRACCSDASVQEEAAEDQSPSSPPQKATTAPQGAEARLGQLEQLLDRGLITRDDFERRKAQILSEL